MSECVLPHDQRAETDDPWLICVSHRRRLDGLTHEIGLLIVDTQRIVDGGAPVEASGRKAHRKIAASPAPGDLGIMALYDARTLLERVPPSERNPDGDPSEPLAPVLQQIASWVLLVAEERPLTATLPGSVLAQLDLLARHHDWLAAHPAVDDYWRELTDVRQALRSAVRDHTHKCIGTCDLPGDDATAVIVRRNRALRVVRICGGSLLVENGSGIIKCGRCRAMWITAQEQARLAVRM